MPTHDISLCSHMDTCNMFSVQIQNGCEIENVNAYIENNSFQRNKMDFISQMSHKATLLTLWHYTTRRPKLLK